MTVEAFLDEDAVPFDNTTLPQIVDVETGGVGIISTLRAMLVTTLGWSEPSADLFKTPLDSASRFMDILCTRISASTLELRLRNQSATTICTRRITIDTSPGGRVFIHASIYGLVIESLRTTSEIFQAHVLDVSSDLKSEVTIYVTGSGHLTTGGANDGSGDHMGDLFMVENASVVFRRRLRRDVDLLSTTIVAPMTSQREFVFKPCLVGTLAVGGAQRWAGRMYHVLRHIYFTAGTGIITKPSIDTNVNPKFRTLGYAADDFGFLKMCVRIS